MFLVSTALLEAPNSVTAIATGLHAGTEYQDSSQEFINRMDEIVKDTTDGRVGIVSPFIKWSKADIFEYACQNSVPIELTYSCEKGAAQPCGDCLSCQDREALNACS